MRTRKILIMAAVTLLFIGCKGNNENKADDPWYMDGDKIHDVPQKSWIDGQMSLELE